MVVENLIFNIRRQGDIGAASMNRLSGSLKTLEKQSKKTTGVMDKLLRALGRIALYRALRTAIKEVTQAFGEGLKNVYQYSKTINSAISQALDSISGASLQMKNQMGAALGELIATIQPIVEAIINLVTRAADALSQLFAMLGGRGFYHKATKSTNEWAAAAGGAAKAAKEWKNQLMGFDEINRLEEPSDRGGGGGGADNIGNWELAPVDLDLGWLEKYVNATKEWFAKLDFNPMINAWERLKKVVLDFLGIVDGALYWAYTNILLPLAGWVIEDFAPASVDALASAMDFLNAILEQVGPNFLLFWEDVSPVVTWIGDVLIEVINWLSKTFDSLSKKVRESDSWEEFMENLNGSEVTLLTLITAIGLAILAFNAFQHPILTIIAIGLLLIANWEKVKEFFNGLVEAIKQKITEWKAKWDEHVRNMMQKTEQLQNKIQQFKEDFAQKVQEIKNKFDEWKQKAEGVTNAISGFFERVGATIGGIVGGIIGTIDNIVSACSRAIEALNNLSLRGQQNIDASGGIWNSMNYSGGYPVQYASGGFPEDGLFMANHGELVGQFSNGRTAVANNEQIVAGIARGVYDAVTAAMSGSSRGGTTVLNINGREFMRATWSDQQAVAREHGVSLIANG